MTFYLLIQYYDHGPSAILMSDSLRLLLNEVRKHPELKDEFEICESTAEMMCVINDAYPNDDSSAGYQLFEVANCSRTTLIAGA